MVNRVHELQKKLADVRKGKITEELKKQLNYAAAEADVEVEIYSGGQRMEGAPGHTGSHRHDGGHAADLKLYVWDKRYLDMTKEEDQKRMETFIRSAVKAGATGVGADVNYMGPESIHIGGGDPAYWGAGAKAVGAPDWVKRAWEEGMKK
jgi:hypothetical protein